MALPSGTKLGPYEIVAPIGAGGMGEVYRAKDMRLGRDVAIKVLPEAFARDADRLRRFEQEARAVAALNHPNILAIHDIGEFNGAPFLVSELLEGHSLREELNSGALPTRRAVEDASQIAKGLPPRTTKASNPKAYRGGCLKIFGSRGRQTVARLMCTTMIKPRHPCTGSMWQPAKESL
jgi:serine/threonine protein kinase